MIEGPINIEELSARLIFLEGQRELTEKEATERYDIESTLDDLFSEQDLGVSVTSSLESYDKINERINKIEEEETYVRLAAEDIKEIEEIDRTCGILWRKADPRTWVRNYQARHLQKNLTKESIWNKQREMQDKCLLHHMMIRHNCWLVVD